MLKVAVLAPQATEGRPARGQWRRPGPRVPPEAGRATCPTATATPQGVEGRGPRTGRATPLWATVSATAHCWGLGRQPRGPAYQDRQVCGHTRGLRRGGRRQCGQNGRATLQGGGLAGDFAQYIQEAPAHKAHARLLQQGSLQRPRQTGYETPSCFGPKTPFPVAVGDLGCESARYPARGRCLR